MNQSHQLRKRVYEFYELHKQKGKKFTADHFMAELVPKSTVYDIIRRFESGKNHELKRGRGRKPKIMTTTKVKQLVNMFDDNDGISYRQAARKFNCHFTYIGKTLVSKTQIKCRKKMKIPLRNDDQMRRARTRCSALYRKLLSASCVMDDEAYFLLSHANISGNDRFYTSDVSQSPPNVKYKAVGKYTKKCLVWVCFSENGLSPPFFLPSGLAVNQKIYLEQIIKKRLIPFIERYHSHGKYIFWPDLASAHYAKSVISYLNEKNINFVKKNENPPNVPEIRPIEDFWGILKGLVYKNNWQAENLDKLKNRIKYCMKKIDKDLIQSLAQSTRSRVNSVRLHGVVESR